MKQSLSSWIEECVNENDFDTTYHYVLDDELMVHIGYIYGFDSDTDDDSIHYEEDPTYCLCIKIGENSYDSYSGCNMPWDVETGEVFDTDSALSKDEDFKSLADWLYRQYDEIREGLDNETLTF